MGSTRKICVKEIVASAGIKTVTEITVTEITDHGVIGQKNGKAVEFPCDYVVISSVKKRDGSALSQACYDRKIGYYEVGDAGLARYALQATREAFDAALTFDRPGEHEVVSVPKKVVFLTGGTGTMGQETLRHRSH